MCESSLELAHHEARNLRECSWRYCAAIVKINEPPGSVIPPFRWTGVATTVQLRAPIGSRPRLRANGRPRTSGRRWRYSLFRANSAQPSTMGSAMLAPRGLSDTCVFAKLHLLTIVDVFPQRLRTSVDPGRQAVRTCESIGNILLQLIPSYMPPIVSHSSSRIGTSSPLVSCLTGKLWMVVRCTVLAVGDEYA